MRPCEQPGAGPSQQSPRLEPESSDTASGDRPMSTTRRPRVGGTQTILRTATDVARSPSRPWARSVARRGPRTCKAARAPLAMASAASARLAWVRIALRAAKERRGERLRREKARKAQPNCLIERASTSTRPLSQWGETTARGQAEPFSGESERGAGSASRASRRSRRAVGSSAAQSASVSAMSANRSGLAMSA